MKKITKISLVLSLALAVNMYSQELINNGGFETGDLTGYSLVDNVTVFASEPVSGTYKLTLRNSFSEIGQSITTTIGASYTASVFYRMANAGVTAAEGGTIYIESSQGSADIASLYLDESILTYTQASFTFTATGTSTFVRISKPDRTGINNAMQIDDLSVVPASPLSVKKSEKYVFKSYPNPAKDVLYFDAKSVSSKPVKAELYNINGAKILSKIFEPGNSTKSLDVKGINRGVYFLKIETDNESGVNKIIID
tara:strand:- start:21332 stop:22093 length:762 start_codon:yes stop_codon:yes gene_type:complete